MKRNVGTKDRALRALATLSLATCSVMAPLPLWVRLVAFGLPALYMLFSALSGTCIGYSLAGRSTCALPERN